jgi:hypothetical protein
MTARELDIDSATAAYIPTSVVLDRLVEEAGTDHITLAWIVDRLDKRSFGLMMLVLGLFGLIPGIATFAGILLLFPAVQMLLGKERPTLPRFAARRRIRTARLARTVRRVRPVLRFLERAVHPRWQNRFGPTKRIVGGIVMLLGLSLLLPVPIVHIVPATAVTLISFAYLEEDGLLLSIGIGGAILSLSITGGAVWGAIRATDYL